MCALCALEGNKPHLLTCLKIPAPPYQNIFHGGQTLMEHNFWRKMTIGGRSLSIEDHIRWKITFDGKSHSMEYQIWWNITFDGRSHSMEDHIRWKITFDGRSHSMEDLFRWKITFDGRLHLIENYIQWTTPFDGSVMKAQSELGLSQPQLVLFLSYFPFSSCNPSVFLNIFLIIIS